MTAPVLTVCCMLWDGDAADRRTRYGVRHVNALSRMVGRNLTLPHDVVCLTDDVDRDGWADGVTPVQMPTTVARWPKRYPKVWMWSPTMRQVLGRRFLYLDLDVVLVDDITPLVCRTEPVVLWREYGRGPYNTSVVLMDPAARPLVWSTFDAQRSPRAARRAVGTDQAWVGHVLGDGEAVWTVEDGVVSYKRHCKYELPDGARITVWHGSPKPWSADAPEWARDAWCGETTEAAA